MKTKHFETKFATMGVRFKVNVAPANHSQSGDYALDIRRDRFGEFFEPRVSDETSRLSLSISINHQHSTQLSTNSGLWCNSSISACEADGPGANPGFLTNPPHIVLSRFWSAVAAILCVAAANPRAPIR